MKETRPPQIKPLHLERKAVIYARQSTLRQVQEHEGSAAHQRGQRDYALRWGWPEDAIVTIEDLGISGARDDREGWVRLVGMVERGEVGIVLASDPSRLARSSRAFEHLLASCRATGTLLAIEGTIADLTNNIGDRVLSKVRAIFAEYDNDQRTASLMAAKRTMARKGIAISPRPTGYIVVEKGQWAKDPNAAVQEAMLEVFRQYQRLGNVQKVLRFYAQHGLKLPVRPPGHDRQPSREPKWVEACRERLAYILLNPAYAGYYVYGRRTYLLPAPRSKDRRRPTEPQDQIVVPDHHEPYIAPAEWHAISEQLQPKRVDARRRPPGTGPALIQGLLRCGRCPKRYRMRVGYYRLPSGRTGIAYKCTRDAVEFGKPKCWSVHGRSLDAVVALEVLRCLAPPELEAVLAAAGEANHGYEAARRQREADLERLRYQERAVAERYREVDPKNRLVAATLEAEWEAAKRRVREEEARQQQAPLKPPVEVTPEVVAAIGGFAEDLPALWRAASTTDEDRKRLVRLFIRELFLVGRTPTEATVDIHWVGGAVTRHIVHPPWAAAALARQLAAQGLDEVQVAVELNRRGFRTLLRQEPYTPFAIRSLLQGNARRRRLGLRKRTRDPAVGPTPSGTSQGGSEDHAGITPAPRGTMGEAGAVACGP